MIMLKKKGDFSNFSLRTKIIGVILFLNIITVSWIVFQVRSDVKEAMSIQLEMHGVSLANNIVALSIEPVLTNNRYELYELIKKIIYQNANVRYIVILNSQGEVLANSFNHGLPANFLKVNGVKEKGSFNIKTINTDEGIVWDIAANIGTEPYGTVRVGISGKQLMAALSNTTNSIVIAGVLVSLLGILLAVILTIILTKPITQLAQATENIAKGEFNQDMVKSRWAGSELVKLINGFNYMVQRIKKFKEETEDLERVRKQLLAKTINAQEEERKRIARELHDEASQHLAAITFGLQQLKKADDITTTQNLVNQMGQIISQTIDSLHRLAWQLRPSVLDDLGLEEALLRLLDGFEKQYGIKTEFKVYGHVNLRLRPEISTTIYRIAQEALTNIARHSGASQAKVFLERQQDLLILVVEDNGRGFIQEKINSDEDEKHLGLAGMRERANLIGATLIIESQLKEGSTVYLKVPFKE